MGKVRVPTEGAAGRLIDELRTHEVELCKAQARRAELMVAFSDARRESDAARIAELDAVGGQARYRAGEFAAVEISLAVNTSKFVAQRVLAMTRRLQSECPDAWDAWLAGLIDQDKVLRINRALRRLVHDRSKHLLNTLVVDVAVRVTPELLGRWLNQFIALAEPDEQDERLRRSMDDRYATIRPDIDGMSFLSALLSAVDAAAIDQILTALAAVASPGDTRTLAQRRSDALVDLLCGRVSNGCHVRFDTNTDDNDHLDDPAPDGEDGDDGDGQPGERGAEPGPGSEVAVPDQHGAAQDGDERDGDAQDGTDPDWEERDWESPASTFRPDPRTQGTGEPCDGATAAAESARGPSDQAPDQAPRSSGGTWTVTPCPGDHQPPPLPAVSIGVVITAQSLFGYSNTPGQLMDRSALIPADTIRDLAQQEGTLFYRLLTDEHGNLLDVAELGRFPSHRLGMAVKFRAGVCQTPTCHATATRCDLDHLIPVPQGPTTATNLGPECRTDHRAKTHAGHQAIRTGPHTTEWVTPTGHSYTAEDPPLPVENWPPR